MPTPLGVASVPETHADPVTAAVFKTAEASRERRLGGFDSLSFPPTYQTIDVGLETGTRWQIATEHKSITTSGSLD